MLPISTNRRMPLALAASLLLHAALLGAEDLAQFFSRRQQSAFAPLLQARLLPPPADAALLKNTLAEGLQHPLSEKRASRSVAEISPLLSQRSAQRKLAEHLFYPPEAISRGLEGEVRLLLTLDLEGKVLDAQIVSSSGHALLDQAATDAAYAMRRLPNTGMLELILPVVFKLQ